MVGGVALGGVQKVQKLSKHSVKHIETAVIGGRPPLPTPPLDPLLVQ